MKGHSSPDFYSIPAQSFSEDHKEIASRVVWGLRERKWRWKNIVSYLSSIGLDVKRRALQGYMKEIRDNGHVTYNRHNSGRNQVLSDEERNILFGAILLQETKVNSYWCMNFIEANFDKEIAWSTLSKYLHDGYLSYQLTGSRKKKKTGPTTTWLCNTSTLFSAFTVMDSSYMIRRSSASIAVPTRAVWSEIRR